MWQAKTKSSFGGKIDELPYVSVDNFETADSRAYFLSHCHTDHTSGLYSATFLDHLKKNNLFVYMSEPSAAIVVHESQYKDIKDYLQALKIGSTTTVTVPADDSNGVDIQFITVTLIPAGHCFGSVMFLFQTIYKTVLYTGDFRISVNSVSKYAQFHEKNGDVIKLDALYVDTTFQDDKYDDFPKRSDSVDTLIRHVRQWLGANDTNQIALHTSAKYGYEFVFKKIFLNTQQKVYVNEDVMRLYSQFPRSVPGVTNELKHSRIHLCRNRSEKSSHEKCSATGNGDHQPYSLSATSFLYIHFSALKWSGYQEDDRMIEVKKNSDGDRIDVCFATHCSRSELMYFVNYLSPKKVVGFPNEFRNVAKRAAEVGTESCCKRRAVTTPTSAEKVSTLENYKERYVDRDLMRKIFDD